MAFLLDTCAFSELADKRPDAAVVEQLLALPRDEIFLSTITLGEIQQGIELLPPSARRSTLETWFQQSVIAVFFDRILPIDADVALRWGTLAGQVQKRGLTMQVKDALIAATALVHDLTLVTRNASDFAPSGVRLFNPWSRR